MDFLLKSEVEAPRRYICPYCFKTQIKKLNTTDQYNKYSCWNKHCKLKDVPFIVLNKYIVNEVDFNDSCQLCKESLLREFKIVNNQKIILSFKCTSKFCEIGREPYIYDYCQHEWRGDSPKIIIFEDQEELHVQKSEGKAKSLLKQEGEKSEENGIIESIMKEAKETCRFCRKGDIPILNMSGKEYNDFLAHHDDKVVVLVDVPNFVRTLRDVYFQDFEEVLKKAYEKLLEFIDNSFSTTEQYVIRYYTNPDNDLETSNTIIKEYCRMRPAHEFFHLLKIQKSGHYSDIDNYLIADGVEILERCDLRGFVIVSSDKDYLPVMMIASHKKVRKYIYGVNTADIYEKYGITDIKSLNLLSLFNSIKK